MSIIDKLGITTSPWVVTGDLKHIIATEGESGNQVIGEIWPNRKYTLDMNKRYNITDAQLISTSPEMLEALIEIYKATYSNRTSNPAKMLAYQKVKDAIEKATGKTWAEIEELKE